MAILVAESWNLEVQIKMKDGDQTDRYPLLSDICSIDEGTVCSVTKIYKNGTTSTFKWFHSSWFESDELSSNKIEMVSDEENSLFVSVNDDESFIFVLTYFQPLVANIVSERFTVTPIITVIY